MNLDIARRRHDSPKLYEIRSLTAADLPQLHKPATRSRIKHLRDSHHNIARRIALGETYTSISRTLGISISRLQILNSDPTFIELVNQYRAEVKEAWREHVDALAELAVSNMTKAERQIADQLDDADATETPIPIAQLSRIAADRMDRFGYGKHTTQTNINVGFAAKLEAAIARSKKVSAT